MPTYEYICHNSECGHEFETFQSMKDDALTECPACDQSTLKRKIGLGAGIIFKGSGFYETDYKRKGSSAESSESKNVSEASKKESTSGNSNKSEASGSTSTTKASS